MSTLSSQPLLRKSDRVENTSLASTPSLYSRLATPADLDLLVCFINETFVHDNYFKRTTRTSHELIAGYLKKGQFLLLEEDGKLIGLIYAELRGEERGYLGMLAVDPEKQRSGIGRQLLQAGEDFCREHGCRVVDASVVSLRPDLVTRYQQLGYRVVGEAPYERPEVLLQPCHFILLEKDLPRGM